ncbi:hypothetical protein LTR78_006544 [Recurvomyces mirabilis]|uniref:Uncharacterized protein n=1 Tax=Recurvomyces mirabilis TaxID=574656 RepID=A0AAE0WKZ9_9PEZI|nr:hypothetical protein LTR78_006544 [Recurvomyces mirabilis]KAK5151038.1 hypothetical protein LTS14_009533 [Recurvomyces mirabilis]
MPELETFHGSYLWDYLPNLPAAIVFATLFTLATVMHTWRMCKGRMWFCVPFVIGGVCEFLGYITRALSTNATGNLVLFLVQSIFLLLPAVFFAATLYMVYSRIIRAVDGERFALITARRTTIYFVVGDFTCLNVQSTGGGLLGSSTDSTVKIGEYIVVAGLMLQILMFAGFVGCCLVFQMRYQAYLFSAADASARSHTSIPWGVCLYMLYGTSAAILLRNLYRVVEFVMGKDGYLMQNEWPIYAS